MPNHIHGIIELNNKVGVENIQPRNNENIQPCNNENLQPRRNEFQKIIPGSVGSIVRGF